MTEVKIVGGKLTVKKEPTAKMNGKPPKYPYPAEQYQSLLKIAKGAGVDAGSTKARQTKAVNLVVKAALDDFIASQGKPKTEPKDK